MFVEYCGSYIF